MTTAWHVIFATGGIAWHLPSHPDTRTTASSSPSSTNTPDSPTLDSAHYPQSHRGGDRTGRPHAPPNAPDQPGTMPGVGLYVRPTVRCPAARRMEVSRYSG